jgi:hypothetical protein
MWSCPDDAIRSGRQTATILAFTHQARSSSTAAVQLRLTTTLNGGAGIDVVLHVPGGRRRGSRATGCANGRTARRRPSGTSVAAALVRPVEGPLSWTMAIRHPPTRTSIRSGSAEAHGRCCPALRGPGRRPRARRARRCRRDLRHGRQRRCPASVRRCMQSFHQPTTLARLQMCVGHHEGSPRSRSWHHCRRPRSACVRAGSDICERPVFTPVRAGYIASMTVEPTDASRIG